MNNFYERKGLIDQPPKKDSGYRHYTQEIEIMTSKRKIEIFSAGCPVCDETIELVNRLACPSCEVTLLDMRDERVASRARTLGVRSVPAVVVNGRLADCCARSIDEHTLRAAGVGQSLG